MTSGERLILTAIGTIIIVGGWILARNATEVLTEWQTMGLMFMGYGCSYYVRALFGRKNAND